MTHQEGPGQTLGCRAMQPRRLSALLAVVVGLALLGVTGCGFGPATQEQYTPAPGANDRDSEVDVLNAVVVAAQPGSGTFIASLANNSSTDSVTFTGVSGAEGNAVVAGEFAEIEIEPQSLVNLEEEGGPTLTGEFGAGNFVPLSVTFADAETVTLDVPVVKACGDFLGLDDTAGESEAEEAYSCELGEVEEEEDAAE